MICDNSFHKIFISGGSGYIGRALIPLLKKNGHYVISLVRKESMNKLPAGNKPVIGNALDYSSFKNEISPCDTFIHLVGVSHPGPLKADQFRKIDLESLRQSVRGAIENKIEHFIYISAAHPAPVMKEYIRVRRECEEILFESKLNTTILRPWYILGPGHRWPYILIPFYKLLERIPSTSEPARRLGLVTLDQMLKSLIFTVENPAHNGIRIFNVTEIRNLSHLRIASTKFN